MAQHNWFAGVDWGPEEHYVCIVDAEGRRKGERSFRHGGEGLAEMAVWIGNQTGAVLADVFVAIEIPHGPVVESLADRGFVLHSINPKQLDRFRDRFSPAGAKDDSRDARVLADALRTDRHCFREVHSSDPVIIELREWSRISEDLTRQRTALGNRMREQLWRYYPQILEAASSISDPWFLDLWKLVPTPAKARRVRTSTLAKLLKRYRIRRISAPELKQLLCAPAIVVAPGTTEAALARIQTVSDHLRLIHRQLAGTQKEIDRLIQALQDPGEPGPGGEPSEPAPEPEEKRNRGPSDAAILSSLPGVGRIVLATLLTEAHDPLKRRDPPCSSLSLRRCSRYPALRKVQDRPPSACRSLPAAQRRVPLGPGRCPARLRR